MILRTVTMTCDGPGCLHRHKTTERFRFGAKDLGPQLPEGWTVHIDSGDWSMLCVQCSKTRRMSHIN